MGIAFRAHTILLYSEYIVSNGEANFLTVVLIAVLLAMVAIGTLLIVHCSVIWGSFQMLLEEGDYSRQEKEDKIQHGNLSRIYWLIVTAGYLAWSFISGKWDRTWIIWPIAAVAYGAVFGITKALRKKNG